MLVCHPEREILMQSTIHLSHHHPMQRLPLQALGTELICMESSILQTHSARMSMRIIILPTRATKSAHNVTKCGVGIHIHNLLLVSCRLEANIRDPGYFWKWDQSAVIWPCTDSYQWWRRNWVCWEKDSGCWCGSVAGLAYDFIFSNFHYSA